jgi:hypothetical protein
MRSSGLVYDMLMSTSFTCSAGVARTRGGFGYKRSSGSMQQPQTDGYFADGDMQLKYI